MNIYLKITIFAFVLILSGCTSPSKTIPTSHIGNLSDQVSVFLPVNGATIPSPLHIEGEAPGNWFFEATAPVIIADWDGRIIAEHYITAQEDWMTTDIIPFSGEIEFEIPVDLYSPLGTIIFQRHNASGLPEHDAAVEVPIVFKEN